MKLSDAVQLLQGADMPQNEKSAWADLGCGSGTFTRALAHLLAEGSTIYAIDKAQQSISSMRDKDVYIAFRQADFEKEALGLPLLDGILMANALHYVADKENLLLRLLKKIKVGGGLLLVEYDTLKPNPWIPYPIDFQHMKSLLHQLGMKQVTKLGERRSVYGRSNIYSCFAKKEK